MRTAYGISWAYLIGDVSNEGYKAYLRQYRPTVTAAAVPGTVTERSKVPPIEDWRFV